MSLTTNSVDLTGKKVLFIAPQFFGCDRAIHLELERRGAEVLRLLDRPFQNNLFKALALFGGSVICRLMEPYYHSKFRQLDIDVHLVLVVNGQTLSARTLQLISRKWPNARKILYMWDSAQNRPTVVKNLDWYDERFSFDPASCKQYGFKFRPLFYFGEPRVGSEKSSILKYKISFIGTCHSDRYQVVNQVMSFFPLTDTYVYLYLQAKWLFLFKKITSTEFFGATISDFRYVGLSPEAAASIFDQSEIILDVEHPKQSGLTIRTFDVIRAGKKLITTNKNVENYDFYDSGNVLVVDRVSPQIPSKFIEKNTQDYSTNVREKYSIQGWLKDVLEGSI